MAGGTAPRTSDNPTHETNMSDSQSNELKDIDSKDDIPTGKSQFIESVAVIDTVESPDGRTAFIGEELGQIIWTREPVDLGVVR